MGLFGLLAPIVGGLIGGGIKAITGANQNARANALERQNIFPTATVNGNILQNVANANLRAAQGIPAAQYNLALQNINRNQAAALRSFERGGRPASLSSILRGTNDATLQLDAQNAQARQQNQLYADQARVNLAQEEQRVWNWNEAQPYLRNLQNIAALRQSGQQNLFGGIGDILSTGVNVAGTLFGGQGQQSGQRVLPITGNATSPTLSYTPQQYIPLPR